MKGYIISFKREKEFAGHAAHELRTPLAAMKMQAQVIQKRVNNDAMLNEDMRYLLKSINGSTDWVNQLLLSRLQNERSPKKPVNLSECLTDSIDYLDNLREKKGIVLSSTITERLMISGHRESLSIMFKNFIENVRLNIHPRRVPYRSAYTLMACLLSLILAPVLPRRIRLTCLDDFLE